MLPKDGCGKEIGEGVLLRTGHCGKAITEGFLFDAPKSNEKFLKNHDEYT